MPLDVDKEIERADEIIRLIDEEVPERAWDKAGKFFEDVREKVASVLEYMESRGRVSPSQAKALAGWEQGVRSWLNEADD